MTEQEKIDIIEKALQTAWGRQVFAELLVESHFNGHVEHVDNNDSVFFDRKIDSRWELLDI